MNVYRDGHRRWMCGRCFTVAETSADGWAALPPSEEKHYALPDQGRTISEAEAATRRVLLVPQGDHRCPDCRRTPDVGTGPEPELPLPSPHEVNVMDVQHGTFGEMCPRCGGMMQRTGSCLTCPSCGENTGCG